MKTELTKQLEKWSGEFGRNYTNRNLYGVRQLDDFYKKTWGTARREMNRQFLLPIKGKISRLLEVGSNVGNQLATLQNQGFENLYGVEIQHYAVEKSKSLTKNINIIQGSAFDIPFKDGYFDLVFTSGVLIHIAPKDLPKALDEIFRCSRRFIWGFEYYGDRHTEIKYRGNNDLLWKANFREIYLKLFKSLKLVKCKKFKYVGSEQVDEMFLLEKKSHQ